MSEENYVGSKLRLEKFCIILSEAINATMREVFGESAYELIYGFAEKHASLKRGEVGEKIEVFYACLERLFNLEGAQIVQAASLKRLCLMLKREYEEIEKYFSLLDNLYEIKFKLLNSLRKQEHSVCN